MTLNKALAPLAHKAFYSYLHVSSIDKLKQLARAVAAPTDAARYVASAIRELHFGTNVNETVTPEVAAFALQVLFANLARLTRVSLAGLGGGLLPEAAAPDLARQLAALPVSALRIDGR